MNQQQNKKQNHLETFDLLGPVQKIQSQIHKAFSRDGLVYLGSISKNYNPDANMERVFYENGFLKESKQHNDHSVNEHFFNEKGLMVKSITTYTGSGLADYGSIGEYVYDENDLQIEFKYYNKGNAINQRTVYEYDDLKRQVKSVEYDKDGNINTQHFRIYNEAGNQIEFKQTNKDNIATIWQKTEFNAKGHMVATIELNDDGTVKKRTDYSMYLDVNGDPIKYSSDQKNAQYYTTEIQTDHHQNWVKKINYYKGKVFEIAIRHIVYYNEPEEKKTTHHSEVFEIPFILKNAQKVKTSKDDIICFDDADQPSLTALKPEDAKWLADKNANPLPTDNFSMLAYYIVQNNDYPSQVTYNPYNGSIEAIALLKELKSSVGAEIIFSYSTNNVNYGETLVKYVLRFPERPGYLLQASNITRVDDDEYEIPDYIYNYRTNDNDICISQIILLRPSDASQKRDKNDIEEDIKNCIENCTIYYKPNQPEIYMVEVSGTNFHLQSHPVSNNFEIRDLDVNYGYGFSKFHTDLMARFQKENKGLVLFHGEPGTGKTFYIRHLLKEMASSSKRVIYMPPNMVDYLVEPNFVTFLSQTVKSYSLNGQFCVLLIEDAEPLLVARGGTETRIQGITNLLNMTDGLLNDMMKLQIICTFNVGLKKLDAALLRPGRLIARKEFKALSELDANLLAQRLGIKHHFTQPTTLSEIYSMLQNKNTIIHEGGGD